MTCDDFLRDPVACAAHADECEKCRALQRDLERLDAELGAAAAIPTDRSMSGDFAGRLPLAPWEEANHRSWGIIIPVVLALIAIASLAFFLGGVSPLQGFAAAFGNSAKGAAYLKASGGLSEALRHAPLIVHVAIVAVFVIVNLALWVLLRRPTRGYDVAGR